MYPFNQSLTPGSCDPGLWVRTPCTVTASCAGCLSGWRLGLKSLASPAALDHLTWPTACCLPPLSVNSSARVSRPSFLLVNTSAPDTLSHDAHMANADLNLSAPCPDSISSLFLSLNNILSFICCFSQLKVSYKETTKNWAWEKWCWASLHSQKKGGL